VPDTDADQSNSVVKGGHSGQIGQTIRVKITLTSTSNETMQSFQEED